jgi:hypothetical protein
MITNLRAIGFWPGLFSLTYAGGWANNGIRLYYQYVSKNLMFQYILLAIIVTMLYLIYLVIIAFYICTLLRRRGCVCCEVKSGEISPFEFTTFVMLGSLYIPFLAASGVYWTEIFLIDPDPIAVKSWLIGVPLGVYGLIFVLIANKTLESKQPPIREIKVNHRLVIIFTIVGMFLFLVLAITNIVNERRNFIRLVVIIWGFEMFLLFPIYSSILFCEPTISTTSSELA